MKTRGLLMREFGVNAILAGRKTMTRRPLKTQPYGDIKSAVLWLDGYWRIEHEPQPIPPHNIGHYTGMRTRCPFGNVGDRLYIRETWNYITKAKNETFTHRRPEDNCRVEMLYRADAIRDGWDDQCGWHPSIHMPKWASRILLKVIAVKVERIQGISEADILAEGVRASRDVFAALWDSIYQGQDYGWHQNPAVFAGTFERLEV